ncbi:MAG TPA: type VII secretion protein EccE [Mycobacterium sp.]|nr:type VII secretion protein EccE [Mycobacterium sp.]
MSARRPRIVWPGPGRITVMLMVIVPAAMAYPWHSGAARWTVGIAAGVVVLSAAWWRGRHLTAIAARRLAMVRRRDTPGRHEAVNYSTANATTTVALRFLGGIAGDVPLALIGGYLQRYGISCDAVRVTSRDVPGERTTWVGLTVSAAPNLAALQARSHDLPLRETAEIALRRLADHLRENGCSVPTAQPVEVPDLLGPQAKERWRAVEDGVQGYVAAFGVVADATLGQTLETLWLLPAAEMWTSLEITGTPDRPKVAVACAIRTDDRPGSPPLPGLEPANGGHWAALAAMHPLSAERLVAPQIPADGIPGFSWPAGALTIRT